MGELLRRTPAVRLHIAYQDLVSYGCARSSYLCFEELYLDASVFTFEVVAISTRCGKQDVVSPWTRSNSFVGLGPLQDRTTSLIASTARASKKPPRGCPSNRPTGARVRFWERLCAPGRNLPRSLRTSPRPVPNFGANGRGKRPSVPDAMANPAEAASDAIDAVRAVADVSVHAVVDAGPTPSSR